MKQILCMLIFLSSLKSFGQIQIGGANETPIPEAKEKERKLKKDKDSISVDGTTEVFLGANWSFTNRILTSNEGVFGDSLGARGDEEGVGKWSFALGIRGKVNPYLMWEGGISFFQNGEKYLFEQGDSVYSYNSNYTFIGMPLKLYFTYGQKKLRFQVGAGLIPQMQLKFNQDIRTVDSEKTETTQEIKTKNGINSFALAFVGNIGVNYQFMPGWGVYVMPEYRHQLTSSYLKTNPYIHKGTALGVSFGIVKTF